MARRTNLAAEISTIDKSGLKRMLLVKGKSGGWLVRTRYECGCKGFIDLGAILSSDNDSNRFVLQALRLGYSCGRHGSGKPTAKAEVRASA